MKDNIARLLEYINCQANPRTFGAFLLAALAAPDPVTAGLMAGYMMEVEA